MKTMLYLILALMTVLSVLVAFAIAKLYMIDKKLFNLEKKVNSLDELRVSENTAIATSLSEISTNLADAWEEVTVLKDDVKTLKERPAEEITDKIEDEINAAREKVFSEWIQNIVNYSPTGGK